MSRLPSPTLLNAQDAAPRRPTLGRYRLTTARNKHQRAERKGSVDWLENEKYPIRKKIYKKGKVGRRKRTLQSQPLRPKGRLLGPPEKKETERHKSTVPRMETYTKVKHIQPQDTRPDL